MKLIRFGKPGQEKPGLILSDGTQIETSKITDDYDSGFFNNGGIKRLRSWVKENGASAPKVDDSERLGPPVKNPGKMICVGLNYADHAEEGGMELPEEPILFFKATSSIVGPNDNVVIPKNSQKTDWEVELAVVIEKDASYVSQEEALDYVAGYCLHNDYSEREFQLERGGQWVKGKSCDTFAPLGPIMATKDEVKDINNLRLWLKVNDRTKQDGNTSEIIFDIPYLVSYISQFMTLQAGDIISTGTPAGVGLGFNPPQYLKPGDRVELGIDGLGKSSQTAVKFGGNS